MANFSFDVNTEGIIHLTDRLERLNRSAFPSAVRATLSDAAFEMKQKNILESAKKNLTVRNKTVFKKFTGVEKAKFNRNIESMQATVGFIDKDGVKGSKVAEGMEHNEVGGIDKEGLMYLPRTRTSNDKERLVRRSSRYNKSKHAKGRVRTKKSFSNSMKMISSFDEKKPVMIYSKKGQFLVQVLKVEHDFVRNKPIFTVDFLMRGRKKHNAKAKATHFNREAAQKTQKQIEGFYQKNAEFKFQKVWK